jgi:5-methylcytosine-specific restriction enzyme subunit McrC
VTLQGPSRFLAKRTTGGNAFLLRPDIVGQQAGDVAFIADTKWKRLKPQDFREGVASADVYQMYAYATRYEAADVVLVYPHHGLLGPWQARRAQYVVEALPTAAAGTERKISVATVDLRDLAQVPAQLAATFSAHLH